MKTKELIRQLKEADPSGEIEVCVDNIDINFVGKEPAYWDGCLEILERDPENKYYNIIGAKITSKGYKIRIHALSIEDAIFDNPGLPVEYDTNFTNHEHNERFKNYVKEWREEAIKIIEEVADMTDGFNLKRVEAGKKKLKE